jgi:hypothetical protein
MNKAFLSNAALAVFALALGFVWHSHAAAQAARARLSSIAAQRVKLDADLAAFRERLARLRHDEAELRAVPKPGPAEQTNVAPKPAAEPKAATRPDTATLLEANPGLRALFRKSFQAELAVRYRPFYDAARLSPEQIRKFEQLMTEAEEVKVDFQTTAQAQGFTASDPALGSLRAQGEAELKAAQTEVLGADGYQQLLQFRRIEPLEVVVNDLATLVVRSPTPLSTAQAEQLLTTMANASSRYQSGDRANLATVDWPQTLVRAQAFLAPDQFTVFKANVQLQQVYPLVRQFYQQQGVTIDK